MLLARAAAQTLKDSDTSTNRFTSRKIVEVLPFSISYLVGELSPKNRIVRAFLGWRGFLLAGVLPAHLSCPCLTSLQFYAARNHFRTAGLDRAQHQPLSPFSFESRFPLREGRELRGVQSALQQAGVRVSACSDGYRKVKVPFSISGILCRPAGLLKRPPHRQHLLARPFGYYRAFVVLSLQACLFQPSPVGRY